jgi:hypothetical protein
MVQTIPQLTLRLYILSNVRKNGSNDSKVNHLKTVHAQNVRKNGSNGSKVNNFKTVHALKRLLSHFLFPKVLMIQCCH